MKRQWLVVLALVFVAALVPVQTVGTTTKTTTSFTNGITRHVVAWVSSAGGAVSANTIAIAGNTRVVQVKAVPDGGGTQPTDLYDLTLVDANSIDVLAGAGANLSNATGKIMSVAYPGVFVGGGTIDIVIANAGNAKGGTITIWIQR